MKILVACEESQAVTIELRRLGHEAYSCDIEPCSGGHPEWHIQGNAMIILNGHMSYCRRDVYKAPFPLFRTQDGSFHTLPRRWDMILAFPPCTNLAVSGARYFAEKVKDGSQQASIEFFMRFARSDCPKIAIENPIGIMSSKWRKPDQIIQPWQFGHGETKSTCLWLKGLPILEPTEIVEGREPRVWKMPPSRDRAKLRSKTYPGIARAMAEQWAGQA